MTIVLQPAPTSQEQPHSPQALQRPPPSDNDRTSGQLRSLDCNLASLCDHIQMEGFNNGAFSDVVVEALDSTYHLHRLILSRSSYFRNMLHGPWKEAGAPTVVLHIDDPNVNSESIEMALAYLYGHHPKLNDSNAFRVLAAASFLDLQDLCAICTDFIISELWTLNFLAYQVFAENQDYGIHGEHVRNACWGYLCQSATMELREVLPKLSSQTLHALFTSNELWVPNEEKRFELALYTLLAKSAISEEHSGQESSGSEMGLSTLDSSELKGKSVMDDCCDNQLMEPEIQDLSIQDNLEGHEAAHNILLELADCVIDFHTHVPYSKLEQVQQTDCSQLVEDPRYSVKMEQPSSLHSLADINSMQTLCSYVETQNGIETGKMGENGTAVEGPSVENTCHHLNSNTWLPRDQSMNCSSASHLTNGATPNYWGRCNMPSWGGRMVCRRQVKNAKGISVMHGEEFNAFINIFEGGYLLYCNMSFEALLNVRKQLEELGFPCKAADDGLWLQMLLYHKVQAIGADTCKNCCLTSNACACRQAYANSYYRKEHNRNSSAGKMEHTFLADAQGKGSGLYGPVHAHVRGAIDGLAGIGVPGTAWPPTHYVFSRVPFGLGNKNCQQSLASDDLEAKVVLNGELSGDGLTALIGCSQGNNVVHVHAEQTKRIYEPDLQSRFAGSSSLPGAGGSISVQMFESQEHALELEWESSEGSCISLDLKTPLCHFPPFRFGVEFEGVHMLADGQVKHSPEVFYAGSLWKVSVQAFSDEEPQRHRTLGLFLHRRKAEVTDSLRKVHIYVDSREKVTARYQLICPSKKEVMVFGSFKQAGTLLPKAPKGWGWRTALLFDELADLLQGGALRVAAVVQLV